MCRAPCGWLLDERVYLTEQLRLQKVIGKRGTIHTAEAALPSRAELMDGTGGELLADPALPRERPVAGNSWSTYRRIGLGRGDDRKRARLRPQPGLNPHGVLHVLYFGSGDVCSGRRSSQRPASIRFESLKLAASDSLRSTSS